MDILEDLRDKKIIKPEDVASVRAEAESSGLSVEQILISRGVLPEEILKSKGSTLEIPTKRLKNLDIPGKILSYIPNESAEHYKMIPVAVKDGVLEVGIVDPDDIEARNAL